MTSHILQRGHELKQTFLHNNKSITCLLVGDVWPEEKHTDSPDERQQAGAVVKFRCVKCVLLLFLFQRQKLSKRSSYFKYHYSNCKTETELETCESNLEQNYHGISFIHPPLIGVYCLLSGQYL